jgi:hypothetical protein
VQLELLAGVPGGPQVQEREASSDELRQLRGDLLGATGDPRPSLRRTLPDEHADVVTIGELLRIAAGLPGRQADPLQAVVGARSGSSRASVGSQPSAFRPTRSSILGPKAPSQMGIGRAGLGRSSAALVVKCSPA